MPKRITSFSIFPGVFLGLTRCLRPRQFRAHLRLVMREVKVAAGRIPPVGLDEIPGFPVEPILTTLNWGAPVPMLAKMIGAKRIFEFGTYVGETAMEIARNCPESSIVTIDLPLELAADFSRARSNSPVEITDPYLFSKERGQAITGEHAARITQIREDSAQFDATPYGGQFDLIYIDASHSYSAVKADSEKAFVMLKKGGIIVWDDYSYPGVWKYLNQLAKARPELNLRYIRGWDKVLMLPANGRGR